MDSFLSPTPEVLFSVVFKILSPFFPKTCGPFYKYLPPELGYFWTDNAWLTSRSNRGELYSLRISREILNRLFGIFSYIGKRREFKVLFLICRLKNVYFFRLLPLLIEYARWMLIFIFSIWNWNLHFHNYCVRSILFPIQIIWKLQIIFHVSD